MIYVCQATNRLQLSNDLTYKRIDCFMNASFRQHRDPVEGEIYSDARQ